MISPGKKNSFKSIDGHKNLDVSNSHRWGPFRLVQWTSIQTTAHCDSCFFHQRTSCSYTVKYSCSNPRTTNYNLSSRSICATIYPTFKLFSPPFDNNKDVPKRSFFQAAVVSILLYGCTTWTLTKRLKKKLDGNYTRMLRAILNKSWRQYPTRHQLYGQLPPITKIIQVRRTRTLLEKQGWAHKWRTPLGPRIWPSKSRTTSSNIHTYSSYVRIRDVTLKTCRRRWMIGRSSERGSGISVLAAQHDDDDDYSVDNC